MHARVAARLDDADMTLRYMRETASLDLDPDPNSAGGIRIAGLGGLWQAAILGIAGLNLAGETLELDPRLPPKWRALSFKVRWRGRSVGFCVTKDEVEAALIEGAAMDITVAGTTENLKPQAPLRIDLSPEVVRSPADVEA
jgi:trehalose/maltose hydrolase-like predicted phosphorylase